MIDFTPIARMLFAGRVRQALSWRGNIGHVQRLQLGWLLHAARGTLWGEKYGYSGIRSYEDYCHKVPVSAYDGFRQAVMRMISGEKDILWPGRTTRFAQSSGTSDGKSKYVPVTSDSLKRNHYQGGSDVVAHYLGMYPDSRMFSGKGFILGGSYANELSLPKGVRVGDLSANLIDNINPLVNLVRVPSKKVALMEDWNKKLPALVKASIGENVTNISGVPSWFLTVLKEVVKAAGADTIHDVWPNLEVFFHGGISFGPYRSQYREITYADKMRYVETYNASEGFFAVQDRRDSPAMLLLLDTGVFYEFVPVDQAEEPFPDALPSWEVEEGKTYALVISACNGLWRYAIGDTVRVETADPPRITIAGRTKHYINAFGEELMVHNADAALSAACEEFRCSVANYTVAPVYSTSGSHGRHQWLIEWNVAPPDMESFADRLDRLLQDENSDYAAKRYMGIFLDRLTITSAMSGLFDRWLASTGKLGGQRKVPRLSNDRTLIESMLAFNKQL